MKNIESWASKTQRRRIVLQVVMPKGDDERWRAEAIDESGSTVALVCDATADNALASLEGEFHVRGIK